MLKAAALRLLLPVAFLLIAVPAGIAAVMAMEDDKPQSGESAFRSIENDPRQRLQRRAEPRWERVATLAGSGAAEETVTIAPHAQQWRAAWSCHSGAFRMSVGDLAGEPKVVETSTCPDVGTQTSPGAGRGRIQVSAAGPWRVTVSQQVDTALREGRLAAMTKAALLARGRVHSIQNRGEGTISVYRLAGGRLALRFEDFYTSASPGLRVWLSRAKNVRSTLEARQAAHVDVGALRSTLGSYNQLLPASIDADEFSTVVIWCPTVLIAFAAAPLKAAPG